MVHKYVLFINLSIVCLFLVLPQNSSATVSGKKHPDTLDIRLATDNMWATEFYHHYGGHLSLQYRKGPLYISLSPKAGWGNVDMSKQENFSTLHYTYSNARRGEATYREAAIEAQMQYDISSLTQMGIDIFASGYSKNNLITSRETHTYGSQHRTPPVISTKKQNSSLPMLFASGHWQSIWGERHHRWQTELAIMAANRDFKTDHKASHPGLEIPFSSYRELWEHNTIARTISGEITLGRPRWLSTFQTGMNAAWITANYRDERQSSRLLNNHTLYQEGKSSINEIELAPYLKCSFIPGERWALDAKLTYEFVYSTIDKGTGSIPTAIARNKSYHFLLPQCRLRYQHSNRHRFDFSVDSHISHPRFEERAPFLRQEDEYTSIQGNPALSPNTTYTASLQYTFMDALSLRFIAKEDNRLIATLSMINDDHIEITTINAQTARSLGLEGQWTVRPLKWIVCQVDGFIMRNHFIPLSEILPQSVWSTQWGISSRTDLLLDNRNDWKAFVYGHYHGKTDNAIASLDPQYAFSIGTTIGLFDKKVNIAIEGRNLVTSFRTGVAHRSGYGMTYNYSYSDPAIHLTLSYRLSRLKIKPTSTKTTSFSRQTMQRL